MTRRPLSDDEISQALTELSAWEHVDHALQRRFTFGDFREALAFLVRVAFCAESLDHHPEIHNVYNRVTLRLNTHDAGNRVTQTDLALARAIDAIG